jgi:predicted ferric reductase
MATMPALIFHLSQAHSLKFGFPFTAISLWSLNFLLRLCKVIIYNRRCASVSATQEDGIVKLRVRVKRSFFGKFHPRPGQYFYLYFLDLPLPFQYQAHPFMIAWWDLGLDEQANVTFLIQPQSGLTAELGRRSLSHVFLDGPYGQDIRLEDYDTVMLVAKGIGIAGVLPYARFLAERRHLDKQIKDSRKTDGALAGQLYRDQTRKVDLFWKLDDNREEAWVSEYLDQLRVLDNKVKNYISPMNQANAW